MEWVGGEGRIDYEFPNDAGAPIWVCDFFGGGSPSPRPTTTPVVTYQRPADVPLVLKPTPRAFLTRRPPGDVIDPHFHEIAQYQIVVEGTGRIGQHALRPLTVHYTDAYTPYGPIVTSDEGMAFFTIRSRTDNGGTHYMPKSRDRMPRRAGRALTAHADVGTPHGPGEAHVETLIPANADGVQSHLISLGAGASLQPASDGPVQDRFFIVLDGSLVEADGTYAVYACGYVRQDEPSPTLTAGRQGAQVLIIQFPPEARLSA